MKSHEKVKKILEKVMRMAWESHEKILRLSRERQKKVIRNY